MYRYRCTYTYFFHTGRHLYNCTRKIHFFTRYCFYDYVYLRCSMLYFISSWHV